MNIKNYSLILVLVILFVFAGCTTSLEVGIDMDSKWANIPMTDDYKLYAPNKTLELIPGLMMKLNSADALVSIPVHSEESPYLDIYGEKGRFLVYHISAWKTGEITQDLPLMMSINVLGWADEILTDEHIIETAEKTFGVPFLRPELVTEDKQDFFLCFPTEGASLGWILHVYKEINGELFLEKRIDSGI